MRGGFILRYLLATTTPWGASASTRLYLRSSHKAASTFDSIRTLNLIKLLGDFEQHAEERQTAIYDQHDVEQKRLQIALMQAKDTRTMEALNRSIASNQQSLVENERVYGNIAAFAESMENLLVVTSSEGQGCKQSACGPHASCTDTTKGSQCVCDEGYIGSGQDCHAPPEFQPHRLVPPGRKGPTVAADVNACVLGPDSIAFTYRDVSNNHVGSITIGRLRSAGNIDLSPITRFTIKAGKAFSPVAVGTDNGHLFITWRDENRGATGWVRAAMVSSSTMSLSWGAPKVVCRAQSHKMALVSLAGGHIAVIYERKLEASRAAPVEFFGESSLLRVGASSDLTLLGQFRFANQAVCRLEVAKVGPTAFVVAARAAKAVDDVDDSSTKMQEAMAVYGELQDGDLIFDPNPINLEPSTQQIWSRGVALVANNTFAYAYQDGAHSQMKLAVVEVSPSSDPVERMRLVQAPTLIRNGFSPYVQMLPLPYTESDPHTLVYYEDGNSSMINLCSWDAKKRHLARCEDFAWMNQRVASVSGVHLEGGTSCMVFTTESGVPYYGLFGLSKK